MNTHGNQVPNLMVGFGIGCVGFCWYMLDAAAGITVLCMCSAMPLCGMALFPWRPGGGCLSGLLLACFRQPGAWCRVAVGCWLESCSSLLLAAALLSLCMGRLCLVLGFLAAWVSV